MHRPIGLLSGTQCNQDFSADLALFPIVDLIELGCGGPCWSTIKLLAGGRALHKLALKWCQLIVLRHVNPCPWDCSLSLSVVRRGSTLLISMNRISEKNPCDCLKKVRECFKCITGRCISTEPDTYVPR
jgi:hypothetical protein